MKESNCDNINTNNLITTNKNSIYKTKLLEVLYIILFYLLIFQNALQEKIHFLRYLDEILALIGLGVGTITLIKNKLRIKKMDLTILILMTILIIIGFYSNLKYKYQIFEYALIDSILIIKFFSIYLLGRIIFRKIKEKGKHNLISINIKIIIIVFFILTILNYIYDLYPGEIRYGIKSNKLFYGHQTNLAAVCIALIANNIFFSKKINSIYNYIALIILVSTMRVKALGAVAVCLIIMIYIYKTNKKINFSKLGIIAIICIAVAYNQISFYFIKTTNSARASLTNTSFKIANDYFPVGTGFGTFGSYISGENYSPIYSIYGINNVFGLQQGKSNFISDTFWPMILGQFGYLGLICYVASIFLIYRRIQQEYDKNDKSIYITKLICLIYLLISSTAEAAFVNPIAMPLGLIMGM